MRKCNYTTIKLIFTQYVWISTQLLHKGILCSLPYLLHYGVLVWLRHHHMHHLHHYAFVFLRLSFFDQLWCIDESNEQSHWPKIGISSIICHILSSFFKSNSNLNGIAIWKLHTWSVWIRVILCCIRFPHFMSKNKVPSSVWTFLVDITYNGMRMNII